MRRVALWGIAGCVWAAGVSAQAQMSEPITEDEVNTYLAVLGANLGQCDAGWLQAQFLPSAKIRYTYPDRKRVTYTPTHYIEEFRRYCKPFEFEKRQTVGVHISDAIGGGRLVRWDVWWGRREGAAVSGVSTATMMFQNEATFVKHGGAVRIADLKWRARELVPGAARQYYGPTAPFDLAGGAFRNGMAALDRWNEQLRQWFASAFRKPAPKQEEDDGWN